MVKNSGFAEKWICIENKLKMGDYLPILGKFIPEMRILSSNRDNLGHLGLNYHKIEQNRCKLLMHHQQELQVFITS